MTWVVSCSISSHFGPRRAAQVVLLGGILCALFSVEDQHTKLDGVLTTFAFFLGAILSASAGWLGMMVATDGAYLGVPRRCLHFNTTRVHLTMTWVVYFLLKRPFGRDRDAPRRPSRSAKNMIP